MASRTDLTMEQEVKTRKPQANTSPAGRYSSLRTSVIVRIHSLIAVIGGGAPTLAAPPARPVR